MFLTVVIFSVVYCLLLQADVTAICASKVPYSRKASNCQVNTTNTSISSSEYIYPILVTSLGGAGTHHITCMLEALGISVGHERIARDGAVGWQFAVNDSFVGRAYPHHAAINNNNNREHFFNRPSYSYALFSRVFNSADNHVPPYSSLFNPSFSSVLHVTRCPIKHIASMTTHLYQTYEFLLHCMEVLDYTGLPASTAQHFREHGLNMHSSLSSSMWDCNPGTSASSSSHRSSASGNGDWSWSLTRRHRAPSPLSYPQRGSPCWLRFSAASWVFWNTLIERYADHRFRIEDEAGLLLATACKNVSALLKRKSSDVIRMTVDGSDAMSLCPEGVMSEIQQYLQTYQPSLPTVTSGNSPDEIEVNTPKSKTIQTYSQSPSPSRRMSTRRYEQCKSVSKRSIYHRHHRQYSYATLWSVDHALTEAVLQLGGRYGYDKSCNIQ